MNKAVSYQISIGQLSDNPRKLVGQYGNTQNIQILLSEKALQINVTLKKNYRFQEGDYGHHLLKGILKKIALVHLLLFQTKIEYSNVHVQVFDNDQKASEIDLKDSLKLYYAIEQEPMRDLPSSLCSDQVINKILMSKRLETEPDMAAINNFILSKTSRFEVEKFTYLWMAFNGAYNYYADCIKSHKANSDKQKIELFLKHYQLGNELLSGNQREKYGALAQAKICQLQLPINPQQVNTIITELMNLLKSKGCTFDLTPIGYLTAEFPYYLRCSVFHANHRALLLSYENDFEMKALRIANTFLEDFLNEHLAEIFLL